MSYGTDRGHKTKKALREDIANRGAEAVGVFGTSLFGNETAVNISELKDSDVVVGPDVYTSRKWYANGRELKKIKRTGTDPIPGTIGDLLARRDSR